MIDDGAHLDATIDPVAAVYVKSGDLAAISAVLATVSPAERDES